MSKKTTTAAAVASATAAATTTTATAKVAKDTNNQDATKDTTKDTETAAKVYPVLDPVNVQKIAVDLVSKHETISAIRDEYAALVNEYGKENYNAILRAAKELRAKVIENAANNLKDAVFTFSGITAAVFRAVADVPAYSELCKIARREYKGNDAERAAAVIKDYFSNVDENGAPLQRVNYVNAAGTQIYAVYVLKALKDTNAVSILKASFDNMKRAAVNAATRCKDDTAATRSNVRTPRAVVAVYAAAQDENGRISIGERRDTSKDERTRKIAADCIGTLLDFNTHVTLTTWNAAAAGNEDAAAAVAAAKDAAAAVAAKYNGKVNLLKK